MGADSGTTFRTPTAATGLVVAQTTKGRPIPHEDLPALTGDKVQPTIGRQTPGAWRWRP